MVAPPLKVALITLMLTFGASVDLVGQEQDVFSGKFINQDTGLSFQARRRGSGYDCMLSFQGRSYEFPAEVILGILTGQYQYQGNTVGVTFARVLGNYLLVSEGYTIPMVRDETAGSSSVDAAPNSVGPPRNETTQAQSGGAENIPPATGPLVMDPYGQYRLRLPPGWKVADAQSQIILSKEGSSATITIHPHLLSDLNSSFNELKDVADPGSDTDLRIRPVILGKDRYFVRMEGKVAGKPISVEYACVFGPVNGGIFITLDMKEGGDRSDLQGLVHSMTATVEFLSPARQAEAEQWQNKLSGKKLLYLKTDRYGTMRTDIDLFADGTYRYLNESSQLSTGYSTLSYADRTSHSGLWKVQMKGGSPVLWLCEKNSGFHEFPITRAIASGNEVFLGSRKYFIQ